MKRQYVKPEWKTIEIETFGVLAFSGVLPSGGKDDVVVGSRQNYYEELYDDDWD